MMLFQSFQQPCIYPCNIIRIDNRCLCARFFLQQIRRSLSQSIKRTQTNHSHLAAFLCYFIFVQLTKVLCHSLAIRN